MVINIEVNIMVNDDYTHNYTHKYHQHLPRYIRQRPALLAAASSAATALKAS